MAISLTKGSRINLAKEAPSLTRVRIGLGWKPQKFDNQEDFDLDVTAFGLKMINGEPRAAGRATDPDFMVFYGNPTSIDGSMTHSGDEKTGKVDNTDGSDDETITVDLAKVDKQVEEISFIVTIHDAIARKQNFGQVDGSYIAIYDDITGVKIAQYNLEEDFSTETACQFGSLYRRDDGAWAFKAVGMGYALGLAAFCTGYGLVVV